MLEGESIRQQSIQLLKEQATRMKAQNREIQLKEDQIRFLKETILVMEQEKDQILNQNSQLKARLKTMASEIANYNTNVVHKIYDENQLLLKRVEEQQQSIQNLQIQKQEAIKRARQSQNKLQTETSDRNQLNSVNQQLRDIRSRQQKQIVLLERENRQLQTKNIGLQRQLDESSSQIAFCSQQVDLLTNKHQQALKIADKKIKQLGQKMIAKQEYQRCQKQLQDSLNRNKMLRADLDKSIKENDRLRYQISSLRDKLLTLEVRQQTKSHLIVLDFVNLQQSVKLGKKITEFQSECQQTAYRIYETYKIQLQRAQLAEAKARQYAESAHQSQIQLTAANQQCKLAMIQFQQGRQQQWNERECMEAQYENKLMEISLRLKKEQIAIAGMRHREGQLEAYKQQSERLQEDHRIQIEALQRTIQQLKKQNFKLGDQLTSAINLCQQSLFSKQSISHFKYVIELLVGAIFYLHLHLLRRRERKLKLYRPFMNYYFSIHPLIQPHRAKINRFKVAAFVVIASIRMKSSKSQGKGLYWYMNNASQHRQKIEGLSQHIENLSQTILGGGGPIQLIKNSENVYRWNINNVLLVRLPIGEDRKTITESCQLELDEVV